MSWRTVPLRQVVEIASGFAFPREFQGRDDQAIPFLKVSDMNLVGNSREIREWTNTISRETAAFLRARTFPPSAVIFPKIGAAIATNKKRVLVQESLVDNNVMAMIPGPQLHPMFLYYWSLLLDLGEIANVGPVPSIRKSELGEVKIPLPPPSEQRRITDILSRADELRLKRREADAKAERILLALFYQMFGDPSTNPKRWPITRVGAVLLDTRNGLYKPLRFYGSGTPILKMFNIKDGWLELTRVDRIALDPEEQSAYALEPGDILLNRVNTKELVGKCAVITEALGEAVFESKNIRVRVNRNLAEPEFVAFYLNTPVGHRLLCQGVKHAIGMATINNSDLADAPLLLPPLELQRHWANSIHGTGRVRSLSAQSREVIHRLFQVLLHRGFSGELTEQWREAHTKELVLEMEQQTRDLGRDGDEIRGDLQL